MVKRAAQLENGRYGCLQAVIDALVDEIAVIDPDYRIVRVNRALLKRVGKTRREVLGRRCYEVSHGRDSACDSAECECVVRQVWETGKPAHATHDHVGGADGAREHVFYDIIASPVHDKDGRVAFVAEVMRDVTKARQAELEAAQALRNLTALNTISGVASRSFDLDEVLGQSLDKTLELLQADAGGILLPDDRSGALAYRTHRGFVDGYLRRVTATRGAGILEAALATGKAILAEDISRDPRAAGADLTAAGGLKGFAAVPLPSKNGPIGALIVASRDSRRFSPQESQVLENIAAQIAATIEKARLHEEMRRQDQLRGELLVRLFAVQEEERRRIARELHDETGQVLVTFAARLKALETRYQHDAGLVADLSSLQTLAANAVDEMNKLIYELRPSLLDDLGLVPALRSLADRELAKAGISVDFQVAGRSRRLAPKLESTVYRVAQEAINNISRHAHAQQAGISLRFGRDAVTVRVKDDGRGFDAAAVLSRRKGAKSLGLLGMRERVTLAEGALQVVSSPGVGTEVIVVIPVK